MVHLIVVLLHRNLARRCVANLGPYAKLPCYTGQRGPSRLSRLVIVSFLSMFARAEAAYYTTLVPLRAVFVHQGSRKGHRLRPTGRGFDGTWMHL